ncbi:glutathione S-transferase theta-1-like [Dendrobates tinctorius]|uniref:glutathione S-transferase theta-1-like n=1 Tax=Dendrobates tinctorius TaxID=92724 RepID=UPI003CC9F549
MAVTRMHEESRQCGALSAMQPQCDPVQLALNGATGSTKGLTPYVLGHEAAPENLNPAVFELNGTLTAIENKFLQDKQFFAGDEISIADLVAIVEIMQPISFGIDVFEDKPKLSAWKQRVEEAVGADLFKEAHESIMHFKELQSLPPELKKGFKARLDWHIKSSKLLYEQESDLSTYIS